MHMGPIKIDWSLDSFGEKKLIVTGPKSDESVVVCVSCVFDDSSTLLLYFYLRGRRPRYM